jgi:hypothetical protein
MEVVVNRSFFYVPDRSTYILVLTTFLVVLTALPFGVAGILIFVSAQPLQ